jgi:hypothetical protein
MFKLRLIKKNFFLIKKLILFKSAIDDILGDNNKDTTHLHLSHLYDANCGICKEINLKKFAQLESLKAKKEEVFIIFNEEEKNNQFNFQNLDPSIQAAILEDGVIETASNELDFLKQRKRIKHREAVSVFYVWDYYC